VVSTRSRRRFKGHAGSVARRAYWLYSWWRSCIVDPVPYRQHRLEANYPGPEVVTTKSPAPPVVVECWCLMVETMDRVRLDRFTRETWKKFDAKDLELLKWAILRRRRVLAMQLRP
jgi:hypothetical protein